MAGIGKFGAKATYAVGDAVWVKGCPRDGVAHIVRFNDGKSHNGYDFVPEGNTYEIAYNGGMCIIQVSPDDLKLAKPDEDAKDKARVQAERDRQEQVRKENDTYLERLTKCEPLDPGTFDSNPMGAMGLFMGGMFGQPVPGSTGDPVLDHLRVVDAMAVEMGRSLGYCGAPRTHFDVGERVRVRPGVNEGFWSVKVGQTGTTIDPGFLGMFPVDPMQPKGINVQWDDGSTSNIYVTNLEPE